MTESSLLHYILFYNLATVLEKKCFAVVREKCTYSELFLSVFSPNARKYRPE